MLDSLMQNPVAWAILSICTVFSVGFAIYTWIFGRKKKEISYTVNSFTLVENYISLVPEVRLLFDNQEVKSLTVTIITLWNSGNDAIQRGEIVEEKPLTITVPDSTEILDVQVIKQNEESNHFSVKMKDRIPIIDFKYMNKKEGAVLHVYHTGPADGFALDCKIIGGNPPEKIMGVSYNKRFSLISSVFSSFRTVVWFLWGVVLGSGAGVGDAVFVAVFAFYFVSLPIEFLISRYLSKKLDTLFSAIPKNLR